MNNTDSPQETLQHYFDDLLKEVQEIPSAGSAPATSSRVVQAPKPSVVTKTQFAEPTVEPDHKARVEKLLQTARPKVKVEAPPTDATPATVTVTPVKAEPRPVVKTSKKPVPRAPLPQAKALVTAAPPKVNTVPATSAPPKVETVPATPAPTKVETAPATPAPSTVETASPVQVEAPADAAVPVENDYQIEGLHWLENGRPAWAQDRFDVLLFTVSGLTLAVPLIALGQIQPLNDELTPIFGQADWFMGLQPTSVGKIRTVNTAKFVMPERYDERFLETAQYVVSINGLPWGLAVDSVNQPITLSPGDVKWRSERSKRAWLAGTVKEHMCALLDIPMMGKLLMDTDNNLRQQ